jgi:hypothetical protein
MALAATAIAGVPSGAAPQCGATSCGLECRRERGRERCAMRCVQSRRSAPCDGPWARDREARGARLSRRTSRLDFEARRESTGLVIGTLLGGALVVLLALVLHSADRARAANEARYKAEREKAETAALLVKLLAASRRDDSGRGGLLADIRRRLR